MKEQPSSSAPKLIFTDEDRQTAGLEKPIADVEKAAAKRDRMKARLRMEHGPKKKPAAGVPSIVPDATAGEMPEKPAAPRLLFSDDTGVKAPGKSGQGIIGKAVSSEVHRQIAQDEEDNTGLQALHTTERTSESALHTVQHMRQSALQHDHKKLVQAEKKLDHANIRFLQKEQEIKHPEDSGSNPLSRAHQRRAIKKEYMAAKAGRSTGAAYGAKRNAQKAVKKTSEATESVAAFIVKHKHFVVVFALVAMLMFLMNALSSCTPLLEAGLQAFVMGTYPAEERDVKPAERAYKTKEDELKRELERYERYHPGYDEYIIEADTSKIWHDPYALISIISAYHGGEEWTIDDVYGTIEMLFGWQYKVTETVTTETRSRTEVREDTRLVTDPDTGHSYWERYTYEVSVPYAYTTCTVTLETETLSHAPVYIMGLGIFNGICAIDLDHCIDADGNYSQTAAEIIAMMHSYTELSPSGTGVHILFQAEGFHYDTNRHYIMNRQAGIEVYMAGATNKYVTITGQPCTAYEFGDRSDELQQVLERFMVRSQTVEGRATPDERLPMLALAERSQRSPLGRVMADTGNAINAVNSPLTTDQLLEKAFSSRRGDAIRRLWSGDTTGYPSHSEADQALCSHLAF